MISICHPYIEKLNMEKEINYMLSIKDIKKEKDLDKLVNEYDTFCREYSNRPDRDKFPYPKVGTILDEEKSVQWNREEVEKLRVTHDEQVKKLKKEYGYIKIAFDSSICSLLAKEYEISKKESEIIWKKAHEDGHSGGIRKVISGYTDLANMYKILLECRKEYTKNTML